MSDQSLRSGILALIRSAITNETAVLPSDFDFDAAFRVGVSHQIMSLLYYGIKNSGIKPPDEISKKLFQTVIQMVVYSENQMAEISRLFEVFERNSIDYMPLKGLILKSIYPSADLRIMGDGDVMIRMEQYPFIRSLMLKLGYIEIIESKHELVWDKPGSTHVELHKQLILSYNKDYYAYYGDGWRLAQPTDKSLFRYQLPDDDQFIYLFTHFSKHYHNGGIGIKHVVDLWVYLRYYSSLNFDYIEAEFAKLQLLQFYKNVRRLITVWFEKAESDEISEFLGGVIFNNGAFGTHESHIIFETAKTVMQTGSAKRTILQKYWNVMFLNYKVMCKKYSILEKLPILLPVMWVARWFGAVFKHNSIRRFMSELKLSNRKCVTEYESKLNAVGLDFNFQE